MPIPSAAFILDPVLPEDPVAAWIDAPRRALRGLQASGIHRLEFEYGASEVALLTWAYGSGHDARPAWPRARALLEGAAPALSLAWEPPTDRLDAVRRVVLPVAEYMNLALSLQDDAAWDVGAEVLSEANPSLLQWMTANAPLAGRRSAPAVGPDARTREVLYENLVLNVYRDTQGPTALLSQEDQMRRAYLARIAAAADLEADRTLARELVEHAGEFRRAPLWTANATAISPHQLHPRIPLEAPTGAGRSWWERQSAPRLSTWHNRNDPTPEERSREVQLEMFEFIAPGMIAFGLGHIARIYSWSRVAQLLQLQDKLEVYLDLHDHVGPASPDLRTGGETWILQTQEQAIDRFRQALGRLPGPRPGVLRQVDDSQPQARQREAASRAIGQLRAARGDDGLGERRIPRQDADPGPREPVHSPTPAPHINNDERSPGKPSPPQNKPDNAPKPAPPPKPKDKPEDKPDDDPAPSPRIELACVSPHADPAPYQPTAEERRDGVLAAVNRKFNAVARFAEPGARAPTENNIEALLYEARLRVLSLINFRPDPDDPRGPLDPAVAAAVAEGMRQQIRITTFPRPDQDLANRGRDRRGR